VWLSILGVLAMFAVPRGRRRPVRPLAYLPEKPSALVILPTYNERETIGRVLDGLLALPEGVDALIVDDGSPDGTAEVVRERAAAEPRIRLSAPRQAGLASAYLEASVWSRRRVRPPGGDGLRPLPRPEELPRLLADVVRQCDLVVGAAMSAGSVTN